MSRWMTIAMHALLAAVFFFGLQRLVLDAPFDAALLWSLGAGGLAAIVAYRQNR